MTGDTIEHEDEFIVDHLIDQQPIRLDVALAAAFVVASERMITIFGVQWFTVGQPVDDGKEMIEILALLSGELEVALKLIGKLNVVAHQSSRRAAFTLSVLSS